jgi:hypothetical protein
MTEPNNKEGGGCIATILKMFGTLCGIYTLVSAVNVGFDLDLGIRVYGARTELPTDWMAVIALGVVSVITLGITYLMTSGKVRKLFQAYPSLKWGVPVGIVLFLSFGFYALYYHIEYSGPLHYATRANDVESVKEQLKEAVDQEDLLAAVDECIMTDHPEILSYLLKHPVAKKNMNDDFVFAVEMGSMKVICVFIDAGVDMQGKNGEFLTEFLAVTDLGMKDMETVGLKLLEAGANPDGLYTGGYVGTDLTAIELARQKGLTKLVAAMEGEK